MIDVKAMLVVNSFPKRINVRKERVETRYGVVFHTHVENAFMIIYLIIIIIIIIIVHLHIVINRTCVTQITPHNEFQKSFAKRTSPKLAI